MKDGNTDHRTLGYSLVFAAGFTLLVAYIFLQGAGLIYYFVVIPYAYMATFAVLLLFVTGAKKRLFVISYIVVGALVVVAVTSVFTVAHGYPVSYQTYNTSCTNIEIPNATSPWGYTDSSQCSTSPAASATSFLWNYLYWLPVSGLALFALPTWRQDKSPSERAGYAIIGLVLMVALLLPLIGIPTPGL